MIRRIIVTTDEPVSQRDWDDFCQAAGLVLQSTGYFAADGLHAGCAGTRVSFFTCRGGDAAKKIAILTAAFLEQFSGSWTPWHRGCLKAPALSPAGTR